MSEAGAVEVGDKYRSHMYGEEEKDTEWRHGGPPNYDLVNKLFEEGRTKVWIHEFITCPIFIGMAKGLLGGGREVVQNAIKSWEMELSHKTRIKDFKTINPEKFNFIVNGREGLSAEETLRLGSYNALLQSSMPEEYRRWYKAEEESFGSSHEVFRKAFPRGFAWEVVELYSGPPVIVFKYRHWGYMEGPFRGNAPTGEMVQFTGIAVLKVDERLRAEDVEIYYDPGELFGGLLKGPLVSKDDDQVQVQVRVRGSASSCPFSKGSE